MVVARKGVENTIYAIPIRIVNLSDAIKGYVENTPFDPCMPAACSILTPV